MAGLEIGLLVIGAVCIVLSFLFTQKLSASDLDELKKMSDTEIRILMDKGVRESEEKITSVIDEKIENAVADLDRQTDKETNEKILEISEYSDTVLESMNKSHDEVLFMYSMLNEKQEKITELTKELQNMESNLRFLKSSVEEDIQKLQEEREALNEPALEMPVFEPLVNETLPEDISITKELEKKISQDQKEEKPVPAIDTKQLSGMERAAKKKNNSNNENTEQPVQNVNDKILSLHNQGYTEIEIAKQLGRGLGEVKLVLGLFK